MKNWKQQWKRKVKREFKNAVRIKGYEGYFVIIGEDITGRDYKVKRIGTGETFYIPKEYVTKIWR